MYYHFLHNWGTGWFEAFAESRQFGYRFLGTQLSLEGVYKVPYSSLGLGVIKSVGEDNQVVKGVREYHGYGKEYNVEI